MATSEATSNKIFVNTSSEEDPLHLFEVIQDAYHVLHVTVLSGKRIPLGLHGPECTSSINSFVQLIIKNAPNSHRVTQTKCNKKPNWNEKFVFHLDPTKINILEISIMNRNHDLGLGYAMEVLELNRLPLNQLVKKTFVFNKVAELDVELNMFYYNNKDMSFRLSSDLCEEEYQFLKKRRQHIFEHLKQLLQERGPRTVNEVPVIGILGSGGGYRAMVAISGALQALIKSGLFDCCTYLVGLSGSADYFSTLYSHPTWPDLKTSDAVQSHLAKCLDYALWWRLSPSISYRYFTKIIKKKVQGQPVSFADFFGLILGDKLLKGRYNAKLSDQQKTVKTGIVPFPLYTCVHIRRDESEKNFHEWLEFNPFEIGLTKYGIFMKPQHFGSKFFMGRLLQKYPEYPLHFLQGLFGSMFGIHVNLLLNDESTFQEPSEMLRRQLENDYMMHKKIMRFTLNSIKESRTNKYIPKGCQMVLDEDFSNELPSKEMLEKDNEELVIGEESKQQFKEEDRQIILEQEKQRRLFGADLEEEVESELENEELIKHFKSPENESNINAPNISHNVIQNFEIKQSTSDSKEANAEPVHIMKNYIDDKLINSQQQNLKSEIVEHSDQKPGEEILIKKRILTRTHRYDYDNGIIQGSKPLNNTDETSTESKEKHSEEYEKLPSNNKVDFKNLLVEENQSTDSNKVNCKNPLVEENLNSNINVKRRKKPNKILATILETTLNNISVLKRRRLGRAGKCLNFLQGLSFKPKYTLDAVTNHNEDFQSIFEPISTDCRYMYLLDAGIVFNSPYPLLMKPQRKVNLIISFDFSRRESDKGPYFKELLKAEIWARMHNLPFPKIQEKVSQIEKDAIEECYIFEDSSDDICPIVVHFVLVIKQFKFYKAPGVSRITDEEIAFGNFSLFDDEKKPYSTFNTQYSREAFDRLSQLLEFNTLINVDKIKDIIAVCIHRLRPKTPLDSRRKAKIYPDCFSINEDIFTKL